MKRTKREKFEELLEVVREHGNEELVELVQNEIAAINAKRDMDIARRAEKNAANIELAEKVYNYIKEASNPINAAQIYEGVEDVTSPQKASSLATYLVNHGKIERVTEKKRVYYKAIV